VCVDFLPEIRHTAVADFNCRPMEDVVCREFIVRDFEKCLSYVSAEWGLYQMTLRGRFFLEYDGRADIDGKESV